LQRYTLAPIFVNCILIASLFVGVDTIAAGHRISYGILASGIFSFVYMRYQTLKSGLPMPRLSPIRLTTGTKLFLKKLVPVLVTAGVVQINIFVGTVVASFCPTGCITYIYCADRFVQLPLAMFGIAMGLVLLPEISDALSTKKLDAVRDVQAKAITFTLRLTLPSVVGLVILAYYLISIVYGHGRFTETAVLSTARILQIVSIGLPASVLVKIMISVLVAQKDSKTPVMAATASIIANAVVSIVLAIPLQATGIAIAAAVSGIVNAYWLLRKVEVRSVFSMALIGELVKILIASAVMGVVMLVVSYVLRSCGISNEILIVTINGVAGVMVYFVSLLLLKDSAALAIKRRLL
jgi:putative peptidoglycan lipid II flippase